MFDQRKSANIKLNHLIKNLVQEQLAIKLTAPLSNCDFINPYTNRVGLCAHVDPGSMIVVYNDDLKVKKLLRLHTDNVKVKFKIIKNGKKVDIAAEAICP